MLVRATKPESPAEPAALRVALAGNPNCGKTSLFNALTGSRQHVGNYPGVTVERRVGACVLGDRRAEVVDLPGTYSLGSFTPEERVACDELLAEDGGLDVVVVVADSTNLKRNLVLLVQVLQTGANPVLALNMADEARAAGQRLDLPAMSRLLGFPVVETVAHRGEGIDELRQAILAAAAHPHRNPRLVLGERLDRALAAVADVLPGRAGGAGGGSVWFASRLLVNDPGIVKQVEALPGGPAAVEEARRQRERLERETGLDAALYLTEREFGFVDGLLREVTLSRPRPDARAVSDKIDRVVAHPILGLPIFAAALYALFWLTFTVGEYPMGWIEAGVEWLGGVVSGFWPEGSDSPLRSLIVDGIIAGVGGVIVFLPNILLLFLGLALMEDTGYMARAAFLTDRAMHRFGLHGKSFLPMVTGFGCTVPAILATRTLEHERDRLTTMFVLPLMSCGARLPIWMLLVPAFFPATWRAPALFGIYVFGAALALGLALLLRRTVLRGEDAPFVMELPPYRMPAFRGVWTKMLERGRIYLRKAGTIILSLSIVLWALSSYPKADAYRVDAELAAGAEIPEEVVEARRASEDLEASAVGRVGRALEPVFAPLGFDWKIVSAMLGAFAAKEVFVSQMGIVYSIAGDVEEESGAAGLRDQLGRDYTPLVGVSLILFLLVATPCMATIAVTRRESGKWSWALGQLFGLTALAYGLALIVYQVGSLFA